jgi:hypothetical protein
VALRLGVNGGADVVERTDKRTKTINSMSKQKEEKSKTMMTLCLPLIEINNTNFYNHDNYKESGMFFVKNSEGIYAVFDIDKEVNGISGEILPTRIQTYLTEQQAEISLVEKFDERISQVNEGVKYLIEKVSDCHKIVIGVSDSQFGHKNMLENLFDMVDEVKNKETSPELPKGGYVSENTLVKIIETVRK